MGNFVSGSLVIALASICCGGFGLILTMCYRVKCSQINFCGMTFTRDVVAENEYEHDRPRTSLLSDPIPPSTSQPEAIQPTQSQPPSRRGSLVV